MTQLDLTFIDVNQCYRMYSAFIIIFSLCAILPLKVKLLSFSQFFFSRNAINTVKTCKTLGYMGQTNERHRLMS